MPTVSFSYGRVYLKSGASVNGLTRMPPLGTELARIPGGYDGLKPVTAAWHQSVRFSAEHDFDFLTDSNGTMPPKSRGEFPAWHQNRLRPTERDGSGTAYTSNTSPSSVWRVDSPCAESSTFSGLLLSPPTQTQLRPNPNRIINL